MIPQTVDGFRLSPQQGRLWALQQGERGLPHRASGVMGIKGPLDPEILTAAVRRVMSQHEILRTGFRMFPGLDTPLQVVFPEADLYWERHVLGDEAEERQEALVEELLRGLETAPVRHGERPGLAACLVELGADRHRLLLALPALWVDTASLEILVHEIGRAYAALDGGAPELEPPLQYADVAEWQNHLLESEETRDGRMYWQRPGLLEGLEAELPFDRPPAGPAAFAPRLFVRPLEPSLLAAAAALARRLETGLDAVLLAGWQILLGRLAQDPPTIAVALSGRKHEELERTLGPLTRYLPLRSEVDERTAFEQVVERAAANLRELGEWQEYFDWKSVATPGRPEPLSLVLGFEHFRTATCRAGNTTFQLQRRRVCGDGLRLGLACVGTDGDLAVEIHYDANFLRLSDAERLAGWYRELLANALLCPGRQAGDLRLLTGPERRSLLTLNDTTVDLGPVRTLTGLFELQAGLSPDEPVLTFQGRSMTWAELDAAANRLARRLGAVKGRRVALRLDRSPEMVIGLMGILKAGAAYVPLDPAYPPDRLAFMVDDCGAAALVTREDLDCATLESAAPLETGPAPEDLAYVIYTSGSTGRPKGVMVTHRAITNRLLWMQREFPIGPGDVLLQKTPYSFDASIWEIFIPLFTGARLVLAEPGGHQDSAYLLSTVAREGITILQLVPSQLAVFLDQDGVGEGCRTLRRLFCGGEALPGELVRRVFERIPGVALCNLYGPTEAAIDATFHPCPPEGPESGLLVVPIGQPLANARVHVVDGRGGLLPPRLPGELYIGGDGLARGYSGQPDLTAERFVPDAWGPPGGRLYRTGDRVRRTPEGPIEFLGRIDAQVKIRGFRIEPGEIEAALLRHPGLREAAVVAREDSPGDLRLVAYVVPGAGGLRQLLAAMLPEHMMPSAFVALPVLPRLPNGKLDRRALPAPRPETAAGGTVPRTPTEELVASLWQDVLKVNRVGREDDFFFLGGHSLAATQLITRLRQVFAVDLPLRALFHAPTVSGLAQAVETARRNGPAAEAPPIAPLPRDARQELPLSFAQQRLWFLDQLEPGSSAYNLPLAVRLIGRLDAAVLAATFHEVVRRHETLRTYFPEGEGGPVQAIDPPPPHWTLPVVDLSGLAPTAAGAEVERLACEEAARPFDLARGPLLRALLARLGGEEHALLATLHHIVSDGWSTGVLVGEIAALYQAFAAGQSPLRTVLPELPIQYADFAVWQRRWLSGEVLEGQLAYWRERLAGSPPAIELPADRPRPAVRSLRGARQPLRIEAPLAGLGRREGATLFMVLTAAFQVLLHRYSGQDDILVGTPVANRMRPELEGLIGFFVNTLVLRSDLSGHPPFRRLLGDVRETALSAWDHQDAPFEELVETLQPERGAGRNPLFQVMLVLQNAPAGALELPGLELRPQVTEAGAVKLDLTLELVESSEGVHGWVEYDTDLFDASTMARFARHFETLLREAVRDAGARIDEIEILDEAERLQVLWEWNDAATSSAGAAEGPFVGDLVAARAAEQPGATALVWNGGAITYADLRVRAVALAHRLRALGVGPEALVAVCCQRSPGLVVAALAVLKAGGAYLPLDPSLPRERLRYILEDAGRPLLVTEETLLPLVPEGIETLVLGGSAPSAAPEPLPAAGLEGDSLAYVIYTSGSTGRPKGTLLTHRGLSVMAEELASWHGLRPGARQLQFFSASFDASVAEIFTALVAGAELHLAPPEEMLPGPDLVRMLRDRAITTAILPPSALLATPVEDLPDLATLIVAGEACPPELVRSWGAGRRFLNGYGPTEATVCVSIGLPEPADLRAPIGRPVAGARLYLLNPALEPVPAGVAGELCVAGPGLARGYLGRPDWTAERFVPHPFSPQPGDRLYRSGDRSRRRPDGQLEFLGRIDQQVKVRGFRVEVEEVEAVMTAQPAVRMAAVAARPEVSGSHRLVGYVVSAGEGVNVSELRTALRRELPEYMVPSAFVELQELPLLPSGKLDRRALAVAEHAPLRNGHAPFVAPQTETQHALASIWAELLAVELVGVHDDFFQLGGNSLLATRVISRVWSDLNARLTVRELFAHPTLEAFAARTEEVMVGAADVADLERLFDLLEKSEGDLDEEALLRSLSLDAR